MTPEDAHAWHTHRRTIVVSQLGPTLLLITTVGLLQFGLADTAFAVRIATAGILLASGILGALVQFHSASEAKALAVALPAEAATARSASWLWVVQYVTPAIFVAIFAALMFALFGQ